MDDLWWGLISANCTISCGRYFYYQKQENGKGAATKQKHTADNEQVTYLNVAETLFIQEHRGI
jgi:hypothetical protein